MTHSTLEEGLDIHRNEPFDVGITNAKIEETNLALSVLRTARIICYIIGGLTIIVTLFQWYSGMHGAEAIGALVEGVIYLVAGLYIPRKPLLMLGIVLTLYILNIVIGVVEDPATLASGFIIRVLVLYYLGKAMLKGRKVPKLKDELRSLRVPKARLANIELLRPIEPLTP